LHDDGPWARAIHDRPVEAVPEKALEWGVVARWLPVLAVLGGCDFVLGLHGFDPPPDAPPGEMPPPRVTGTYMQHWLQNDLAGSPTKQNLPPTSNTVVMNAR
jgi:hypothetical protein